MRKLTALCIAGLFGVATLPASAALFTPTADMKARQEMVRTATESDAAPSGSRATASQEAENVALSRQIAPPTLAEHIAEVKASAVYGQSGPDMATLEKKNLAISKELPKQTMKLGTPEAEHQLALAATP